MRDSVLKRFAIATFVALTVASAASLALCYVYSWGEALKSGATQTEAAADVVSVGLQSADQRSVFDPDSDVYSDMREFLRWVCETYHLVYASVYSVNEERTVRTYYYAVGNDDEDDELMQKHVYFGFTSESPLTEAELLALSGRTASESPEQIDNAFGTTYAWLYPLRMEGYDDYFVICAEFNVREIMAMVHHNALAFAVPMLVILMLMIALELSLMRRNVVIPLRTVSSRMRNFITDRANDAEPLVLAHDDEIGEIADSFNQMSTDIGHYVERIEELAEERVAASTELQVARRIQLGLVPETSYESGPGFEAFALFRAAREVGGDFYDLFIREDGRVCVVMADVSGKGVSAALFMSMCRTLLHEKLSQDTDPAQALNEANESILRNNPEGMFVTAFVGVYDTSTKVLRFANAGHTKPYVIGRGYIVPDPGIVLGIFEGAGIVEEQIELLPGEGILLYTDGANEAVSANDTFFGEERLAQAVCDAQGAQEAVHALTESIDAFATGREQSDDLTLLCLFAGTGDVWHWSLSPEMASIATLRIGILELCGNVAAVRHAILALDEAFSNIVNYSGASRVDVWAMRDDETLSLLLTDDGVAFDPLKHDADDRTFEDFEDGGMGISFIRQLASGLSYERTDGCNVLTMTFDLEDC